MGGRIFDGEGCVYINRLIVQGRGPYFSLNISVGQSGTREPPMLTLLSKTYGGKVRSRTRKPDTREHIKRYKPAWTWELCGTSHLFLKRIQPYVHQKADQVEIALRYYNEVGRYKERNPERAEQLKQKLSAAKKH